MDSMGHIICQECGTRLLDETLPCASCGALSPQIGKKTSQTRQLDNNNRSVSYAADMNTQASVDRISKKTGVTSLVIGGLGILYYNIGKPYVYRMLREIDIFSRNMLFYILSLVTLCLGMIAIVLGIKAKKRGNIGLGQTGIVLGCVVIAMEILWFIRYHFL